MSNCCKTIRSKNPYFTMEIEMRTVGIFVYYCFTVNGHYQLRTPIQLVSVLFIMVLRCHYSIFLILVCELFLQVHTLYSSSAN